MHDIMTLMNTSSHTLIIAFETECTKVIFRIFEMVFCIVVQCVRPPPAMPDPTCAVIRVSAAIRLIHLPVVIWKVMGLPMNKISLSAFQIRT